jgi:methyltransferase-like protein/SAM-dependent methyltransferase
MATSAFRAAGVTAYDEVPYPSCARSYSHPDRLAVLATLLGMRPAAPERARVLELGSSDGANLLGMAYQYPEARFLGIDLAPSPIERGRAIAERLGVRNLELRQANLLDFQPGSERFDYIIAHGLYSWVPQPVRTRILQLCAQCLDEQGIAFISYNAYPGGHFRAVLRDLMRFHTQAIDNPQDKVAAARTVASMLADWIPDAGWGKPVKEHVGTLLKRDPSVLFHDDLSAENQPFYFHEFVSAAAQHGLQYLSDADTKLGIVPTEAVHHIQELAGGDLVRAEQYTDFLCMRSFRETLLCRQEVRVARAIDPDWLAGMFVASNAVAEQAQDDGKQKFHFRADRSITTNHPWTRHALTELAKVWPSTVPLTDFTGWRETADTILRLYVAEALHLRTAPLQAPAQASEFPVASLLARTELQTGSHTVTNAYHEAIELEDNLLREFIMLLDGTRDRTALAEALIAGVRSGQCTIECPPGEVESTINNRLEQALERLRWLALLVA